MRLFAPDEQDLSRPGFFERRPGEPPTPAPPVWLVAAVFVVGLVVAAAAGLLSGDRSVFGILVGVMAWVGPILIMVGHSTVWLRRLRAGTLSAAELRRAEDLAATPAPAGPGGPRRERHARAALSVAVFTVVLVPGALVVDDEHASLVLFAAWLSAFLVDAAHVRVRRRTSRRSGGATPPA